MNTADNTPSATFIPLHDYPHVAQVRAALNAFSQPSMQAVCKCGWQGEHRSFYPDALNDANLHVQGECAPRDRA